MLVVARRVRLEVAAESTAGVLCRMRMSTSTLRSRRRQSQSRPQLAPCTVCSESAATYSMFSGESHSSSSVVKLNL
ncbi:hypothetical protein Tco_1002792 [Tanacetum coccineum]|uniref:Secreted protein n=1 Tax=Tanacetum coccineum TaxID=301880 RepID=A0ABQ5F870_9ASTR